MSAFGDTLWPRIIINLRRIDPDLPPAVIAAFERIGRLGSGGVFVRIDPSCTPFFDYGEALLGIIQTCPADGSRENSLDWPRHDPGDAPLAEEGAPSLFWPCIVVRLDRIRPGRPLPAALIAAFQRIGRLGWGSVDVRIDPSCTPFVDYAECFLGSIETGPADEQANRGDAEGELGQAGCGEDLPWPAQGDELAGGEGPLRGVPRHLENDLDGYFEPTDPNRALLAQYTAALATLPPEQRPFELRNWKDLTVFMRLPDVRYGGAFGTLLTVEGRRYLATFEPLPAEGGLVRFADRDAVG